MLPAFPVPVTLDGQAKALVAVDLPLWAFFWGHDHGLSDAWLTGLLLRAVVKPVLTPELVARLGDGFTEPAIAYLLAVGYLDAEDVTDLGGKGWAVGRAAEVGNLTAREVLEAKPEAQGRVGIPLDALRGPANAETAKLIATIADRSRIPPHVLWHGWTVSEFYLTSRMLQLIAAPAWGPN